MTTAMTGAFVARASEFGSAHMLQQTEDSTKSTPFLGTNIHADGGDGLFESTPFTEACHNEVIHEFGGDLVRLDGVSVPSSLPQEHPRL